jgi:hypothetical protein
MPRPAPAAIATLAVAVLVGCGSSGGQPLPGSSTGGAANATSTSTSASGQAKPVGPPPQKETLAHAETRIRRAIASGGCGRIDALTLAAHRGADPQMLERICSALKRSLAGQTPTGGQSFKGLAAVLDYTIGTRHLAVVLVRGADGLYHIVFFDRFETGPTVGTPFARQFDGAVKLAFDALRNRDCDAYLKVAYVVTGPATKGRKAICSQVEKNLVAVALSRTPSARPRLIGGNRYFAFYGLDGVPYLTLAMAREAPSQRPPGLKAGVMVLPKGAPEYAFLRAYPTNAPEPPSK